MEETPRPPGAPAPKPDLPATPATTTQPGFLQDPDADTLPGWMDHLLSSLYQGVLAPAGFQKFVEELTDVFECKAAILYTIHRQSMSLKAMWVTGIDDRWMQRYALDFAGEDVFAENLIASQSPRFLSSNLDMAVDREFEQSRFFREWLTPQGIVSAAGVLVLNADGWQTPLVLQRSSAQRLFSRDDLEHLDRLLPHLRRALQMRERLIELEKGQGLLAGSLNVPTIPTLLLDEQNLASFINRNAAALLAVPDAPLRLENGRLIAREREVNQRLQYEVGSAIRASRGEEATLDEIVLVPRAGRLPLSLMVAPLRSGPRQDLSGPQAAALVFVFDPENLPVLSTERVRKMFSLTSAEAVLAAELCRGASLDEVAAQRGVSTHTIRTQLKSVFLKTGTNRQTELVALLLASPAYFVAP